MARKTFYPGFRNRLQELNSYLADHADSMEAYTGMNDADKAALLALQSAVQTAQKYFPAYRNVA